MRDIRCRRDLAGAPMDSVAGRPRVSGRMAAGRSHGTDADEPCRGERVRAAVELVTSGSGVVQAHRASLLAVRGTTPRTPTSAASRSCSRRRRPRAATSCGRGCTRSSSTRRSRCAGSASAPCPRRTTPQVRTPCPPRIASRTRRRPAGSGCTGTAEALGTLKPSEMQCMILKALGYSYDEIAARTGFSWTKVNRSLTEGRRRFFERFGEIAAGTACRRYQPLLSAACDGHAGDGRRAAAAAHTWRRAAGAGRRCASTAPLPAGWPSCCRRRSSCRCSTGRPVVAAQRLVRRHRRRAGGRDRREAPAGRRGGERAEGGRGGGLDRRDRGRRRGRAARRPAGSRPRGPRASRRATAPRQPEAAGRRRARARRAAGRARDAGAAMMRRTPSASAPRTTPSEFGFEGGRRCRPAPVARVRAERTGLGRRDGSQAREFAAERRLGSAARRRRRGVRAMRARLLVRRWRARRAACRLGRRRTRASYEVYACGGAGRRRAERVRRVGRREHGRLLDLSSGQLGRDRHRHQGDVERRRRAVLRRRVPGLHRSARSVAAERHLQRRRDPAARLLVGGHRRVRRRLRSGRLPYGCYPFRAGLRRRHAHVLHRDHGASVQPRAASGSRRAAATRAGVRPPRAGSRPATAPCSRPRTCPCGSTTGPQPALTPHSRRAVARPAGIAATRRPGRAYTDNVGIMVTRLTVDGEQRDVQDYRDGRWPDWVRCDFTRPRPCVDIVPGGLELDTAALTDGAHRIAWRRSTPPATSAASTHDDPGRQHAPGEAGRPRARGRRGLARA